MGWARGYFDAEKAADRVLLAQSQLDYEGENRPLVIAVSEPLGRARSPFVRELFIELHAVPLKCSLIPVSGFYLPRSTLRQKGILEQKGAPATIAVDRYFETLRRARGVRRTHDEVWHPSYTAMRADPVWPVRAVTATTDVVITEGPWCSNDFSHYASMIRGHVDQLWRLDAERTRVVSEFEAQL